MPPKTDPRLLEAVAAYLDRGWTVIPLCWPTERGECSCGREHTGANVGKAPLTRKNGELILFTPRDKENALKFWQSVPANIGIRLVESSLVVLDFDDAEPGDGWLGWVRTSRGGHVYFDRGDLPPTNAKVTYRGRTVDFRGVGYVVAPPSRHRHGHTYEWVGRPEVHYLPVDVARQVRDRVREVQQIVEADLPDRIPKRTIEDLPIPDWLYHLIVTGQAPEGMRQYGSRSEAEMAAITGLARYTSLSDAEIAGILLNEDYAISAKPLQRGSLRVLMREIAKARKIAENQQDDKQTAAKGIDTAPDNDDEDLLAKYHVAVVPVSKLKEREYDWLIEGLVPAYGMVSLVGNSRAGKSRLVRHMMACLMEGSDFLGRKVTRPWKVLYVVSPREANNNELKREFERLGCDIPVAAYAPGGEPVSLLGGPTGEEFIKLMRQIVRRYGFEVVVIDSLSRYMYTPDVKQEDHVSMAVLNQKLSTLADELVCLINIIHSTRKEATYASGAVPGADTNTGAYQAALLVTAHRNSQTRLIQYHTLDVDLRGAPPPERMYLVYDDATGRFHVVSEAEAKGQAKGSDSAVDARRAAILAYIQQAVTPTRLEIVDAITQTFDVSDRTVYRDLTELEKQGLVTRHKDEGGLETFRIARVRVTTSKKQDLPEGG